MNSSNLADQSSAATSRNPPHDADPKLRAADPAVVRAPWAKHGPANGPVQPPIATAPAIAAELDELVIKDGRRGVYVSQQELLKCASALLRRRRLDEKNAGIALRALIRCERVAAVENLDAAHFCVEVADRIGRQFPDADLSQFTYLWPGLQLNSIDTEAFFARIADAQTKRVRREATDQKKAESRRAAGLVEDEAGKIKNCLSNVLQILRTASAWEGKIRYNELSCRPVVTDDLPIECEPGD